MTPIYTVADLLAERDPIKRNEQALLLAESGAAEVLQALITLITRSDLKDQRGTLVHCLRNFDHEKHLHLLTRLVVDGNWEVAHEAFSLICEIEHIGGDLAVEAYALLQAAQREGSPDQWRSTLISDLIEMFD